MIDAKEVNKIFMYCLFNDDEVIDGVPIVEPINVDAVLGKFGFHPDRIATYQERIIELLQELPIALRQSSRGGGMSFLNAYNTKDGEQWGEHKNMNELFALGLAIKEVKYCLPKKLWESLPGAMPYLVLPNL